MNKLTIAAYRSKVYKLLSGSYKSPEEDFYGQMNELNDTILQLYPDMLKDVSRFCDKPAETLEELKVEHARLFLGPFRMLAPPYGSMYIEGDEQLMTISTMDVLRRYADENMDVAIREVPDHISIELEYMYYLVFSEMKAFKLLESEHLQNGNERNQSESESRAAGKLLNEVILDYKHKQIDFLNLHLSRWIPHFEKKVSENTESGVYLDLATITNQFISVDLDTLTQELLN